MAERTSTRKYLSRWNTLKIFSYGVISGLACARALRLYQRWRLPNVRKIQSSVLPILRANEEVRGKLGSSLKVGLLTGYSYSGGLRWRLPRVNKRQRWSGLVPVEWNPWALRVLLQVIGEKSAALVTLETQPIKQALFGSTSGFNFVMVDFKTGERLVVKGTLQQPTVLKFDRLNIPST